MTRDEIVGTVVQRQFGRLVPNLVRGAVVEAVVHRALPGSVWMPDWSGWDFELGDNKRIEVKQSARLQTWPLKRPHRPTFDCAPRAGYWPEGADGYVKAEEPTRFADVYVFAHHPVEEQDVCDHCDPHQWDFYVLLTSALPADQKTIALSTIVKLGAEKCDFASLRGAVAACPKKFQSMVKRSE